MSRITRNGVTAQLVEAVLGLDAEATAQGMKLARLQVDHMVACGQRDAYAARLREVCPVPGCRVGEAPCPEPCPLERP